MLRCPQSDLVNTIIIEPGYTGMVDSLKRIDGEIAILCCPTKTNSFPTNSLEMLEIESSALAFGRRVSSLMVARSIVLAHLDKGLIRQAGVEVRRSHTNPQQRMQSKGWRSVNIRLSGGDVLRMKTPYYRPRNMTPRGRPRGTGKRGVSGVGAYSLLEYLGIRDNVTPVTRSMVCRKLCIGPSFHDSTE